MKTIDPENDLRDEIAAAELLIALTDRAAIDCELIGDKVGAIIHRKQCIAARRRLRGAQIVLERYVAAVVDEPESVAGKTITERLENWARAMLAIEPHATSTTGIICESMERWHMGDESNAPNLVPIDDYDAELVNRAIKRLNGFQREILIYLYRWRATPEWICRKMVIKPRPRSVFDLHRHRAEDEVERHLRR
jgi:hypothetical protein